MIKKTLGVGNLGTIFLCYDELQRIDVVLKVYHHINGMVSA